MLEMAKGHSRLKLILIVTTSILVLDQLTKWLAKVYLKPVHSVSVIGKFFRLTYVENPGIAFGIRVDNKVFFTLLSLLALIVIFYYLFTIRHQTIVTIAFASILGGAIGNLVDRFLYGRVVDFLDFDFFNMNLPSFKFLFFRFHGYAMDRWPVFNVADMAVSVGMIIIIFTALFTRPEDDVRQDDPSQTN